MDFELKGKVALVAGASRGLGYAVARRLAGEGAHVSICSRDAGAIAGAKERIERETGVRVMGMAVDVRSADAIAGWHARTLETFAGVDLLYINSGGPPAGTTLSFPDQAWKDAFDLLVLSALRMIRAAVPSMKARGGGAILLATSSSVREPIPNLALSNIVRAAVAAMTKTLADELAPDRIRVNSLMPGRIETDRIRELDALRAASSGIAADQVRTTYEQSIPLGRYGQPDEFARAAAFLLSEAASYITGASLRVDGGMMRSVS
jgi:3-oxoacyl-[acyl-carrier protein] reductase